VKRSEHGGSILSSSQQFLKSARDKPRDLLGIAEQSFKDERIEALNSNFASLFLDGGSESYGPAGGFVA